MAEQVWDWSTTASSNDAADSAITWLEGQVPGTVNGSARSVMAALAKFFRDNAGIKSTAGAANTYTLAAPHATFTALTNGITLCLKFNVANTGPSTFNLNALGSRKIKVFTGAGESELLAGQIQTSGHYQLQLDTALDSGSGAWVLLNPTTDPTALFTTGSIKIWPSLTLETNWLWLDGKTIGNASSLATARANADTSALFTLLWTHFANTECPVSTGRGASAAADYAANKTITLPDFRGRIPVGQDGLGGTAASRLTSASGVGGWALTNGGTSGAETVTLSTSQIPSHTHTGTTASGGAHTHTYSGTSSGASIGHTHGFSGTTGNDSPDHTHSGTTAGASVDHTHSGTTGNESVGHTHTYSGTTGDDSPDHTHTKPSNAGSQNLQSGGGISTPIMSSTAATDGASARHQHTYSGTTAGASVSHTHTVTTGGHSADHTHTITTGGRSVFHQHAFSGTTGDVSVDHTHTYSGTTASDGAHTHTFTSDATGGGALHTNMPPVIITNYVIRL